MGQETICCRQMTSLAPSGRTPSSWPPPAVGPSFAGRPPPRPTPSLRISARPPLRGRSGQAGAEVRGRGPRGASDLRCPRGRCGYHSRTLKAPARPLGGCQPWILPRQRRRHTARVGGRTVHSGRISGKSRGDQESGVGRRPEHGVPPHPSRPSSATTHLPLSRTAREVLTPAPRGSCASPSTVSDTCRGF